METSTEFTVKNEVSDQRIANLVDGTRRWNHVINELGKDEKVKDGLVAFGRTVANIGITAADIVPGVGDAVSWGADLGKVLEPIAKTIGISTDLTPDVPKSVAIGSEAFEAVTGGVAPSHAVETILQLKYDIPRMIEAVRKGKEIVALERADYQANKTDINVAMRTFGVSVPYKGTA